MSTPVGNDLKQYIVNVDSLDRVHQDVLLVSLYKELSCMLIVISKAFFVSSVLHSTISILQVKKLRTSGPQSHCVGAIKPNQMPKPVAIAK